jgi:muramoyltetrapeptide carboxypeptidase
MPDAIVLLEDINEDAYRIDRMLTQLLRAGWFDEVAGVALGSWLGCPGAEDVIAERLVPLGIPILAGLPFGHGARQRTIPLGAVAELDADAGTLTLH